MGDGLDAVQRCEMLNQDGDGCGENPALGRVGTAYRPSGLEVGCLLGWHAVPTLPKEEGQHEVLSLTELE